MLSAMIVTGIVVTVVVVIALLALTGAGILLYGRRLVVA